MFDFLQLAGGLILAIGYIPQIIQLIKTRSSRDLNAKTYLSLTVGILLMEVYAVDLAVQGSGVMFLVTNSISLFLTGSITALIFILRRQQTKKE